MRPIMTSLLLLACAPLVAIAATPGTPLSAVNIVRFHPGPWRMPAPALAGMRFDPETGEATVVDAPGSHDAAMLAATRAEARRLAAANITRHADGSLHAVVGAALRQWSVATIDEQGHVTLDCLHSEADVQARVEAAAKKQVKK